MPHYKDKNNKVYFFVSLKEADIYQPGLTEITDTEKDALLAPPAPTADERKKLIEISIMGHIQSRVDEYNAAHGLSFRDVYSCALYARDNGYTHQQFCLDVWAWNVAVWEHARSVLADVLDGIRSEPTAQELIAELPSYSGVA